MNSQRAKKTDTSHLSLKRKLRKESTKPENKLWYFLRDRRFQNLKFKRQHGIDPYVVDYYCSEKNLVIEIDGDVHDFPDQIKKDRLRSEYLRKRGLEVVRYNNRDVLENLKSVLHDLYNRIMSPTSTSP
jgi:very-short-patch-repair endonuclease